MKNVDLYDGIIGNVEKTKLQGRLYHGAKIYTCNPFEDWLNNDNFILEKGLRRCLFPYVWLGNIKYDDDDFLNFLQFLFDNNINVYWEGCNNKNKLYGPNGKTNNISYIENANVPPIPKTIRKEISNIDELNLFQKLKEDEKTPPSNGWYYFSLLSNSLEWSDNAKQYLPSLINYINNIKKYKLKNVLILKLLPRGYINIHTDNYLNYKIPLNSLNLMIDWPIGCEIHMWTDTFEYCNNLSIKSGKGYYVNTNSYHMVRNLSNRHRYVVMIHDNKL